MYQNNGSTQFQKCITLCKDHAFTFVIQVPKDIHIANHRR